MDTTVDLSDNLFGYQITEELYVGNRTLVYRGIRESDQQSVVIKLLHNTYPSFQELVQFRNQYTIMRYIADANIENFEDTHIIAAYSLETYHHGYALIMEDFGGISLQQWKREGTSLSLGELLQIAIDLCHTLDILHQECIIHKDIKPANILINPATKQVKLIDFSIASLLPRESQGIQSVNTLEGTLAYLSPEQTGRMNRGIDYRSDFYALGVTFYELLAGKLPFVSEDPIELTHCHLAKTPIPVHQVNAKIPVILSTIIDKLMAKNAEDRYQSALGIKHDLEICLEQLQETKQILYFEIGQRDLSDRFTIPEKLYGRETEVKSLLEGFDRVTDGASELMLVAGFSGIGKTTIINEIHKPITRQRGYFIKGKYDQFQRNIPFSAFVQAFRDLIGQILSESDHQLNIWKTKILEVVGNNGQILIEVIPELEYLIGKQSPALELSGNAAQNRFDLLLQKFVQIFANQKHPLVIFLDDLQWADTASLKLLQLLVQDTRYLLVLGAYRDNEVSPSHPFILTADEITKSGVVVNTINLQPLKLEQVNQLVADTLKSKLFLTQPLADLIYQKAQGNPFLTTQFIKALYEDGQIRFDIEIRSWQYDIFQIQALVSTNNVVEFMALQLRKLPEKTQNVLKLAACIGAQFDLRTLATIHENSLANTATALRRALLEGLIIPNTEVYKFFMQSDRESTVDIAADLVVDKTVNLAYRFLHDRVQQAAYSLIPDQQRQLTHHQIGQLLLQSTPESKLNSHIFSIANHLNMGIGQIHLQQEKYELAKLNLIAGQKAKISTAYHLAFQYLRQAIDLLDMQEIDYWHLHHEFTLTVYETATEVAYLIGDFTHMTSWGNQVLLNAQNIFEKIKVYEVNLLSKVTQKQLQDAIAMGLEVIASLGIYIPNPPTNEDLQQERSTISELISTVGISALQDLPVMTDVMANAVLRIANVISVPCYLTSAQLFQFIVLTQVRLSILYGNAPISVIAYARYGIVLCGVMQEIATGYQFGNLALALLDEFKDKDINSRTLLIVGALTLPWKAHLKDGLPLLQAGYEDGLSVGNLEPAALSHYYESQSRYILGEELTNLQDKLAIYSEHIRQINQEVHLNYNEMLRQVVLNLLGETDHPTQVMGTCFNENEFLSSWQENKNAFALYNLYIHKAILCYWFEEVDQSINNLAIARDYLRGVTSQVVVPLLYFYDALTKLAFYPRCEQIRQAELLEQIAISQEKLNDWAIHSPMNFQHKVDLVVAEKYRVLGQKYEAGDYYDRAIFGAKENGYIQEEALANELAAKFYLEWDRAKVAQVYMVEAYYSYSRWGAKAKIKYLETLYPQLLEPIFRQSNNISNSLETLVNITNIPPVSSNTNITDSLDFVSILKTAQTISSEIKLDELLRQLTQIILQNSGADKCVLTLLQDETWLVKAISTPEATELQSTPLDDCPNTPLRLLQYIKRTNCVVVVNNLETNLPIVGDYLNQYQPKSILGLPILSQGHLVGIIYLENKATSGVFNSDRLTVVNFLCTQAAISLENSLLYQTVQQNELKFRAFIEDANDLIFSVDLDTIFTYLSPQFQTILGYKVSDFLSQSFVPLVHPEDLLKVSIFNRQIVETGEKLAGLEFRTQHQDGTWIWITCNNSPIKDEQGEIIGIRGIARDISERKYAEKSLQLAQFSIENACLPMWWIKPNGQFAYVNRAACQELGYSQAEILQRYVWDFDINLLAKNWDNNWQRIKARGFSQFETQTIHRSGLISPVEITLDYIELDGEEYQCAIARNISDRKAAEAVITEKSQELMQALQNLQQTQLQMIQAEKMSALGNLVAGVAHEINNPVGFLSGNIVPALNYVNDLFSLLDLYQRKYPQPDSEIQEEIETLELEYIREDLPKLIDSMKEGVKRIRDISNSLRTFSRADSDRSVACNIHDGIDSTIMILKHRLKSGQSRPEIAVIKNYGDLPRVECYAGQLNQVFMNILANAIDALDESNYGRSFEDIKAHPNYITITTLIENNWVKIIIADNGRGMSEEVKNKIFDHLFTTKEVGKGTGLGLAIARQIVVEKHGGVIAINSTLGQGTEFVISLPIKSD